MSTEDYSWDKIKNMKSNILESFSLAGKKAIVVGGAGDLGKAMVEAISQAGAQTVVIDFDEKVFDICEQFRKDGLKVDALRADISRVLPFLSVCTATKVIDKSSIPIMMLRNSALSLRLSLMVKQGSQKSGWLL